MDGIDTMKAIKQLEDFSIPKIVCLTANVFNGSSEYYKSLGFDGYLAKPLEPHELDRIVKKFLKLVKNV